jgi:hypothetical protein
MEHVNCPSQQPYYIQSDITKAAKGKGKKKKKKKGEKKKERVPWVLEQSKESLIIYDSDRQILIWT